MSLKDNIKSVLDPILPTFYLTYSKNLATYITYFEYNRQTETASDDLESARGHYWQIDIWRTQNDNSSTDLDVLTENVIAELKSIEFTNFTKQDLYESDTKTAHIAIRCYFFEEI